MEFDKCSQHYSLCKIYLRCSAKTVRIMLPAQHSETTQEFYFWVNISFKAKKEKET